MMILAYIICGLAALGLGTLIALLLMGYLLDTAEELSDDLTSVFKNGGEDG